MTSLNLLMMETKTEKENQGSALNAWSWYTIWCALTIHPCQEKWPTSFFLVVCATKPVICKLMALYLQDMTNLNQHRVYLMKCLLFVICQCSLVQQHLECDIRKLHLCRVHLQETHVWRLAGIVFYLLDEKLTDVNIHYAFILISYSCFLSLELLYPITSSFSLGLM